MRSLAIVGTDRVRDLEPLVPQLARLRQLSLIAGLSTAAIETFARAPMPNLELLAVRAENVATVLGRCDLPRLHELVIDHPVAPDLIDAIATSSFASRLEALGLRDVDSNTALYILDNLRRFPALTKLSCPYMRIDPSIASTLRGRLEFVGFLDRYSFSALSK